MPSNAAKLPSRTSGPGSNRTRRAGGAPEAITRSSSPQRASRTTPGSCTWWVESVSLGKVARSTRRTRRPLRASSIAVEDPATLAPTTITSYMGRPKEHGEETRERLLEAAARILTEEGAQAVTIRRVADEVGTTTRAIYS